MHFILSDDYLCLKLFLNPCRLNIQAIFSIDSIFCFF
nr:MAG TPA: hypothetical protein [Caudoviricetes sp.]